MLFINSKNEYPRHIGDLQLEYPDWKEGDDLPTGWKQVEYATELPTKGDDELIYEGEPVIKNGKLTQNFLVRKMTAEEIERRDAPKRAKEKLLALGLTEAEIQAFSRGLIR